MKKKYPEYCQCTRVSAGNLMDDEAVHCNHSTVGRIQQWD